MSSQGGGPSPPGGSGPQPPEPHGPTPRERLANWSPIIVASMAAIATIVAALIALLKPDSNNSPAPPPRDTGSVTASRAAGPLTVSIQSIGLSNTPDGRHVIDVAGKVTGFDSAGQELFVVARPVGGGPIMPQPIGISAPDAPSLDSGTRSPSGPPASEPQRFWYVSDRIRVLPDGSWIAKLTIDASELRQLQVQATIVSTGVGCPPGYACAIRDPSLALSLGGPASARSIATSLPQEITPR